MTVRTEQLSKAPRKSATRLRATLTCSRHELYPAISLWVLKFAGFPESVAGRTCIFFLSCSVVYLYNVISFASQCC